MDIWSDDEDIQRAQDQLESIRPHFRTEHMHKPFLNHSDFYRSKANTDNDATRVYISPGIVYSRHMKYGEHNEK